MTKAELINIIHEWILSPDADLAAGTDPVVAFVQSAYGTSRVRRCKRADIEHVASLAMVARVNGILAAVARTKTICAEPTQ